MATRIRHGSLRNYITIQRRTLAKDAVGQSIATWGTQLQAWAAITPISGTERNEAEQQTAELTHVVTILYRSGLKERDRVLFGSRVLEIVAIRDVKSEKHFLEMDCQEQPSNT